MACDDLFMTRPTRHDPYHYCDGGHVVAVFVITGGRQFKSQWLLVVVLGLGDVVLDPLGQRVSLSTGARQPRGLCSQPRPWTHIQSALMDFPPQELLPALSAGLYWPELIEQAEIKGGLNYCKGVLVVGVRRDLEKMVIMGTG